MGYEKLNESNVKTRILENAVRIFSEKGFHGTSIRDIASASECSLPTLYYYYKSKDKLFEEIVVNQFFIITEKMNRKLDLNAKPEELYFQVIQTRNELKGFEKEVYKMALKIWLGFDGKWKAKEQVANWENKRAEENRQFIDQAVKNVNVRENVTEILINYMENAICRIILLDEYIDEDVTEILINYMENVICRIILLDEYIDDEKLKKQIALLFRIGK